MSDTSKDTTLRHTPLTPEHLAARARLEKKWGRPPWALKTGTVVVSISPFKPREQKAEGK